MAIAAPTWSANATASSRCSSAGRAPGSGVIRNRPGYADATGNLRLYMTQLRRKLEPDPARPRWLHTEPGMGYRHQPDQDQPVLDGSVGDGKYR